jgi:hypothetical protein
MPLDEIRLATLIGVVCRSDDWKASKGRWTGCAAFLLLANGIPTAQTFSHMLRLIDV